MKRKRTFDRAKDLYKRKRPDTTIIGKPVSLEGILECSGNVLLSGRMTGKIMSPGIIYIEKGGSVKGNIMSDHAIIEGSVDGELNVKEKVELGKFSRVKGDIMAGSLAIERGAFISGNAVTRLSTLHLFTEKRKSLAE